MFYFWFHYFNILIFLIKFSLLVNLLLSFNFEWYWVNDWMIKDKVTIHKDEEQNLRMKSDFEEKNWSLFMWFLWICVSAKFIVDCVFIIFLEQSSQKNVPLGSNMSNVTNQNGTGLEQQVCTSCTCTLYWFLI